MAVEIHDLEVVPSLSSGAEQRQQPGQEDTHAAAPQPDIELQIRRTTSWLHSRDHRLRAD